MTRVAADSLRGEGGLELFTQSWLPAADEPVVGVIVIVHGLGEHSSRYEEVAQRLVRAGFAVDAIDHRGHGRSAGERALVDTAATVADVDRLLTRAVEAHPGVPVLLLGHSLGGMIATAYAIAHGDRLAGLVLSGPLAVLDVPAAQQRIVRAIAALTPRLGLIGLDPSLVSRDPAVVAAYREDPLVHHGRIPAGTVAEISRTVATFPTAAAAITVPTLILYGTADGLCPPRGSAMLAEAIAGEVTVHAYDGLFHEILNEPERATVIDDLVEWLGEQVAGAQNRSSR